MAKSAMNKSAEFEHYYQELGNNKDKIFDSMKDVFMMAAAVGFRYSKTLPFSKSGGEPIALRFFNDDDRKIMDLIALSITDDIGILLSDDEIQDKKYKLIEDYANGGMSLMVDAFCKPVVDINELYKFVESFENSAKTVPKANVHDILQRAMDSI
ncbi:MAG: hypothetical protein BGN88_09425 [Clostridiales bacterium 43-6]|nr:MAG: hypothetical protein BGN88_09425 [Clostridiales bacterium 43-6]